MIRTVDEIHESLVVSVINRVRIHSRVSDGSRRGTRMMRRKRKADSEENTEVSHNNE